MLRVTFRGCPDPCLACEVETIEVVQMADATGAVVRCLADGFLLVAREFAALAQALQRFGDRLPTLVIVDMDEDLAWAAFRAVF